ncbi:MAG: response regulator [Chloroflexota bacterium]|nr:response regulator [Chloroflexota bacterium]
MPHKWIDSKMPLGGWLVLVVDDEDDSRAIAEIMLMMAGAEVSLARDGAEALALLHGSPVKPAFILSDLSMPVMDGWQLMLRLSQDSILSAIPMIALTAHAMRGDRERALAAGFRNHITKPLNASKFVDGLLDMLVNMPEFAESLRAWHAQ